MCTSEVVLILATGIGLVKYEWRGCAPGSLHNVGSADLSLQQHILPGLTASVQKFHVRTALGKVVRLLEKCTGWRVHRKAVSYYGILSAFLILFVLASSALVGADSQPTVKNLIYMIGDGMSVQQLESARIVKGGPLVIDSMPVHHQARNASASHWVTDSAAAGTAHATGHRTANGMVGMTVDGRELTSILRLAKEAGKATGVVVTDVVYGATPGAYLANVHNRSEQPAILEQALFRTQPDVLLGGGLAVFNQIGGLERLSETPYRLVRTRDELLSWDVSRVQQGDRLLGLFASGTMTYEVDRKDNEPHISEMVEVALNILSRSEDGFFLMIEGSRIDHAGHANDLRRSVYETLAFDEAVAVVLEFAAGRDDTLVIVTADHETGGLTPGGGTPSPKVISQGAASVASQLKTAIVADPDADLAQLFATEAGITELTSIASQGTLTDLLNTILTKHSFYYTTGDHTDTPVPVRAFGPGAERFAEVEHIADMGQLAIELLGVQEGGDI